MIAERRTLLFLSHRLPVPPHNGAAIRTYHLLRALADRFRVRMLCFDRTDTASQPIPLGDRIAQLPALESLVLFDIPQQQSRVRWAMDHFQSLLTGRAYTHFVHRHHGFQAALRHALKAEGEAVLFHVDSLDLVRYLPFLPSERVALTHHNIESKLLARRAARHHGPRGWYIGLQSARVAVEEHRWASQVALNVVVSEPDQAALSNLAPQARTLVIPNGVDTSYFRPFQRRGSDLVFTGGLNYYPNREGMEWLVREVLPRLRSYGHEPTVYCIGRASRADRSKLEQDPQVRLTGYVDDIRPHAASGSCFVAPLLTGGGTRLKILDAWAMGLPVVSTSVACEGLKAIDGDNILIRDDPATFAEAVATLLKDRAFGDRLAACGRQTAEMHYDWSVIGASLVRAYEAL